MTDKSKQIKKGDILICKIEEYGGRGKEYFDCNVIAKNKDGVDVVYLSGFHSRNDFVKW